MKKIFVSSIMLLLCTTLVFASRIDGKWKASIETENGLFEFTLDYKVEGDKLSGKLVSDMGEVYITDGKVSGDEFEYKIDAGGYIFEHKGKLISDNEIKINSKSDYGDNEYTIKRVPE